jgi:phosphomethylpyrimidine synthase
VKKISSRSVDNSPESKEILKTATKLFNGSKKVYIQGSTKDINVPVRKVLQTSSITSEGKQNNPPIFLYDTSGPYSDPDISIDIEKGLPKSRDKWLKK